MFFFTEAPSLKTPFLETKMKPPEKALDMDQL